MIQERKKSLKCTYVKKIIKWVIFVAIPFFFQYLSQSNEIYTYLISKGILSEHVDKDTLKEVFLVLYLLSALLLLFLNLLKSDIENSEYKDRQDDIATYMKEVLTSRLRNIFQNEDLSFDIRIFVPRNYTLWRFIHIFCKKKQLIFVCKNKKELANEGIKNNLEFEVYPNAQGLVGLCYQSKQAQYDNELDQTNSEIYNLNHSQIEKTRDLKFSLVYPIYKNKNKTNSVIAIVGIDSESKLDVTTELQQELRDLMSGFSQYLYKLVPEAFKGR